MTLTPITTILDVAETLNIQVGESYPNLVFTTSGILTCTTFVAGPNDKMTPPRLIDHGYAILTIRDPYSNELLNLEVNQYHWEIVRNLWPLTKIQATGYLCKSLQNITLTITDFNKLYWDSNQSVWNSRLTPNNSTPNIAPDIQHQITTLQNIENKITTILSTIQDQTNPMADNPTWLNNILNSNNLAWTKLADQYDKLLNMFRIILHQQTSLLTTLVMKDQPKPDNPSNLETNPPPP